MLTGHRIVNAFDVVFGFQPKRGDVELQHADRAQDQVVVFERLEQLGRAFLGQLLQALLQGLGAQRVLQDHAAEQFRREVGNAVEFQRFALGEGVADLDGAVVVQADDVAGIGLFDILAAVGLKGNRIGDLYALADAHMVHLHALVELARTNAHEGDAVAVGRVHVRLDLEHEAGELVFVRLHDALLGLARHAAAARIRRRRPSSSSMPKLLIAEPKNTGVWRRRR